MAIGEAIQIIFMLVFCGGVTGIILQATWRTHKAEKACAKKNRDAQAYYEKESARRKAAGEPPIFPPFRYSIY